MRCFSVFLSCLVFSIQAGEGVAQPAGVEPLGRVVQAGIEDGYCSGVVVMAGQPDRILLHEAFGHARVVPRKVPMHKDSLFDLASVTKVVATATACAVCADEGLIDLDAPVRNYLGGLTGKGIEKVTLRHLATHTSGLDNRKYDSSYRGEAMLQAMLTVSPRHEPGTHYGYSCLNFILLGLVVEQVSGERLDVFCEDRIFRPLGMRHTRFGPVPASTRVVASDTRVVGQISDGQARVAARAVGNAGLFSAAADLARFCRMMLGRGCLDETRVISESALDSITRRAAPGSPVERGFGWDLRPEGRPKGLSEATFYHTGWTGQSVWIDPEGNTYVIVLTNRTHPRNEPARYEAAKRFRIRVAETTLAVCGQQAERTEFEQR